MNEEYYVTQSSLKDKAVFWEEEIKPHNIHQMKPNLASTALLVIDMQNFFLDSKSQTFTPGGLAIIPNIEKLIKTFRKNRLPVIYTAHVHKSPEMDGGLMSWWWQGMVIENTDDAKIHKALAPRPEEKIIYKHRYSGFYNTDLEITLRCLKITDLVICGIMTNLCCETTARDAFMRDFRVFFLLDATGTVDEEFHLATLKNLAFGFAYVTKTEEILKKLDKKSRRT
jgi:isochorismate hydrolase